MIEREEGDGRDWTPVPVRITYRWNIPRWLFEVMQESERDSDDTYYWDSEVMGEAIHSTDPESVTEV